MINNILIHDAEGNRIYSTGISVPEGGFVIVEDSEGPFIKVNNSGEEDPIGIIIDVYDENEELFNSMPILYDEIVLEVEDKKEDTSSTIKCANCGKTFATLEEAHADNCSLEENLETEEME